MFLSITRFKKPVRVWGLGVLLGLSVSTMLLPQDVLAKGKKQVATSVAAKKVSKKNKSVKKTVSHNVKRDKAKAKRSSLTRATPVPAQVWQNTKRGKQAYYIMPGTTPDATSGNVVQPINDGPQPIGLATENATAKLYQIGTASYYGSGFHGKRTASGESFNQEAMTCAHGSLPFGCRLRVTNLRNNQSVNVRVNDRGGFHKYGRVLDLSKAAARKLGMLGTGTAKVKVEVLE